MKRLSGQSASGVDPFDEAMNNIEDDPVVQEPVEEQEPVETEFVLDDGTEPEPAAVAAVQTDPAVLKILDTLAANQAPKVEVPVSQRAVPAAVDMAKLRADFNEKLHTTEDPASLVDAYANQLIGPQLAQQNIQLQNMNKATLVQNPKYAYILEHFGGEVEAVINALPANQQNHPDAYKYASDQILIKRFDEVVKGLTEANAAPVVAGTRLGKTQMVASQSQSPVKNTKRQVRYTQLDVRMAKNYGMNIKDYMQRKGA